MFMKYALLFITIETVYLGIVAYIGCKTNKNIGTIAELKHFRRIRIFFAVEAISQILWMANYAKMLSFSLAATWIVNMVYVAAFGLCMYAWLRFIVEKVRFLRQAHLSRLVLRLQTVTTAFHMLMIVTSVWTGWIFYIDAEGMYVRGSLFWINAVCCYSHWVWTTILFFVNRKSAESAVRHQLQKLLLLSFLPVFGGILQIIFYDIPFLESSLLLSIFFMFSALQEEQIKTDALTGLNNRSQFERTYEKMLSKADTEPFVLFVADIDSFKYINDSHGHLVGDEALLLVANGLRRLGSKYPSLCIYRYGGDEFVFLIPEKDITAAKLFAGEVNETLPTMQQQTQFKFAVRLSIGYQRVNDKSMSRKEAFELADQMLYREKRSLPRPEV